MPRRKTGKRARVEDPEDLSQPIAKRINQMDLTESPQECDVLNGNNSSSVQLRDRNDSSRSRALTWQPLGIGPVLDMPLTGAYDPEVSAADNPHYYQVNKVLYEAHVQWIQRQQPIIDPWLSAIELPPN